MPIHNADDGSRRLAHLIRSLQSALRRRSAAVGAMWATAGALAAVAGLLALDWSDMAPAFPRTTVYGATGAAAVAAVAGAAFVAWRRRPSPVYVARLIETQRPELKNAVLTFVELAADPSADPSMTAAVARRAATILARDNPDRFLPPLDLRRPLIAVLAAAAINGGLLWLGQGTRIRPWVASADAGLMGAGHLPAPAAADLPHPAPPPSGSAERRVKPTADRRAAAADAAAKPPAPKPSPGDGTGETAASRALAAAIRADAKTFDRLAAALAADQAHHAEGHGTGSARAGKGHESDAAGTPQHESDAASTPRHESDAASTPRHESDATSTPRHESNAASTPRHESNAAGTPRHESDAASTPQHETDAAATPRHDTDAAATPRHDTNAGNPVSRRACAARAVGDAEPRPGAAGSDNPPLPDHEPSEVSPKNALDTMRRARRLIEEADRRLGDGEVTDAFLDRMGVGNAEFRRFVVAWQRKFEALSAGPAVTRRPRRVHLAAGKTEGKVLRPTGGSEAKPVAGPVNLEPDGRKESVQGTASGVSARLQPAVRAYFRAIDQLTAEPGEKEPLE